MEQGYLKSRNPFYLIKIHLYEEKKIPLVVYFKTEKNRDWSVDKTARFCSLFIFLKKFYIVGDL